MLIQINTQSLTAIQLRIQCTCEDLLLILYQSSTHPGYMAVEGTSSGSLYSGTLICRGDNPASIWATMTENRNHMNKRKDLPLLKLARNLNLLAWIVFYMILLWDTVILYITMGIIVVDEDWLVVTKGTQRHHVVSRVILNVCHRILKIQLRKHDHLITWANKTNWVNEFDNLSLSLSLSLSLWSTRVYYLSLCSMCMQSYPHCQKRQRSRRGSGCCGSPPGSSVPLCTSASLFVYIDIIEFI